MNVPLGVVPYMQIVAPILDEKEVQRLVAEVEKGSVIAMVTLMMHNQALIEAKINLLLASRKEHEADNTATKPKRGKKVD